MPLVQVPKSTLVEEVIARLEDLITSGEWPVGFRVPPEPELVRALGVSRNTVREAVRALVHAGLLDPRPGDGTYVRADNGLDAALERAARRWGALDALEVRNMLERDAARLAAQRRDEADLAAIEAALRCRAQVRQVPRPAAGPDREAASRAFVDADAAFHQAVAAATHNRVLIELYSSLGDPLRAPVAEVLRVSDDGHDQSHQALARAIRDGDPAAAELAATELLAMSLAILNADEAGPR
ncbi:MAG TPA: FCD domain-containing protein [Trebonia sp.]|nr:FCD domain-containing protein [Trebonia sp.]